MRAWARSRPLCALRVQHSPAFRVLCPLRRRAPAAAVAVPVRRIAPKPGPCPMASPRLCRSGSVRASRSVPLAPRAVLSSSSVPLRTPLSVVLAPLRLGQFLARDAGTPLPCPLRGKGTAAPPSGALAGVARLFLPAPEGFLLACVRPLRFRTLSGFCVSSADTLSVCSPLLPPRPCRPRWGLTGSARSSLRIPLFSARLSYCTGANKGIQSRQVDPCSHRYFYSQAGAENNS